MSYRRTEGVLTASLTTFVLIVASLGFAGVAGAATATSLEAEAMTGVTGSSFSRSQASASGGRERVFWSNGRARGAVETPAGFAGLQVRARGDACIGAPNLEVRVDGRVAGQRKVSGTTWGTYSVSGSWSAGWHTVEVAFTNDSRTRWCDRNLYVDLVRVTALTPTPTGSAVVSANPFTGARGYVQPFTDARREADARRGWDPTGAAALDRIASSPQPFWVGDWNRTDALAGVVDGHVDAAVAQGALPVLVAYAIPYRDCGGHSAGGVGSAADYAAWLDQLARGIGDRSVAVVLEPDALTSLDCLDATQRAERFAMLSDAVTRLGANPRTSVYLDAGNSSWKPVAEVSSALRSAGVDRARGFSLNVSNFVDSPTSIAYGESLSTALGGRPTFVVDTSRNGLGSNGEWCNPAGRALGTPWTTSTGSSKADALLWLKRPGESDGTCNGGPPAGQFWVDYAIGLATRSPL